MEIYGIFAIGIVCAVLITALKKDSPITAVFLSIAGGIMILFMIFPKFSACFNALSKISFSSDATSKYVNIILKITGIAYLAEFCTQICIDCGQNSIASKIEIGAKVFILVSSMPVILGLIKSVNALMP